MKIRARFLRGAWYWGSDRFGVQQQPFAYCHRCGLAISAV